MDIYPARELPIEGINSAKMIDDLNHVNKKLIDKTMISKTITESESKVFALIGAGDIGDEIQLLKSENLVK